MRKTLFIAATAAALATAAVAVAGGTGESAPPAGSLAVGVTKLPPPPDNAVQASVGVGVVKLSADAGAAR